jgi:hypothetical protein
MEDLRNMDQIQLLELKRLGYLFFDFDIAIHQFSMELLEQK